MCVYTHRATDLVVDTTGYLAPDAFGAISPARLLETRFGATTVDGEQNGTGAVFSGQETVVTVAGRAGVPTDARAVSLSVAAILPPGASSGWIAVFPCGAAPSTTSLLNYRPDSVVANSTIVAIGVGGAVCLATNNATDAVVDVTGYIP